MSSVVGPLTAAAANALQQQLLSNQAGSQQLSTGVLSSPHNNPYITTRAIPPNDAYMAVEIKFIENGFIVSTGLRNGESAREVFCADLTALGVHMQAVVAARQLDRSMK